MPARLHAVPTDPTDQVAADTPVAERHRVNVLTRTNQLELGADSLTDILLAVGGDLDGSDLVALAERLADIGRAVGQARRIVDALGHDWCVAHGKRGRVEIDGTLWRATISGSSSSLKVADKARLADDFFRDHLTPRIAAEVVTPWLADTVDKAEVEEAADLTAQLLLSLVLERLPFTLDPKATELREQWGVDVSRYASPSTGAGPSPSFAKVPTPPPTKESKT